MDNQEGAVEFLQSAANRFRDGLLDSLAVVDAPSSVSYGHVQVQLFSDWNSCPLPSLPYCEAYRLCHDKFSSLQSANPLTVWLCPVKKKKFPPPRRPFAGQFLPEIGSIDGTFSCASPEFNWRRFWCAVSNRREIGFSSYSAEHGD